MSYRSVMSVSATLAVCFGAGFIFLPEQLTALYGLALGRDAAFVGRLLGVEFFGFGLLAWLVRNAVDSKLRRSILLAFLVTDGLGAAAALHAQATGAMNSLGWSIVGVFLLMSAAWCYLWLEPSRTGSDAARDGAARLGNGKARG